MSTNVALKMAVFSSGRLQIEIAKACRIHETRLSKIIRGHVDPTPKEKLRLAIELGVTPDVLFVSPGDESLVEPDDVDNVDQPTLPFRRKAAVAP